MHPLSRSDSTTSTPGEASSSAGGASHASGPAPKRARHEAPGARSSVIELGRPALLQPAGPSEAPPQDFFRRTGGVDVNGPENERISPAGQAWWLGRAAQEELHWRLPPQTAAWARRLEFSAMPQAEDRRWLPAYRQRCPNLQEIALPMDSDAVMPALRAHAVREAGGRWVLRLNGREDGVGAFQQLCDALGRSLHGHVKRPGVLGSHGRPRVFRQLVRDIPLLRARNVATQALAGHIGQLVSAITHDHQIAWRCAHVAQVQGGAAERLAAMNAIAAELQRAPMPAPPSFLPEPGGDALADMILGFSRGPDPAWPGAQTAEPRFWPIRPRWLDRAEARAMTDRLAALPSASLTPVLRAMRDEALRVLRPQAVFDGLVFLSREEEELVIEALHLARLFEVRVCWPASAGARAPHPMPDEAKQALARLRDWVDDGPRDEGTLRRERWYLHLAGQAHAGAATFQATAGLLRGAPGRKDLDPPPVELVEAIARARGEPLALTLDYRGERVSSPVTVNGELSDRLTFGIRLSSAWLIEEAAGPGTLQVRMPAALQWSLAEWLTIELTPEDARRGGPWRERVGAGLLADFPAMTRLFVQGDTAPDAEPFLGPEARAERNERHRQLEEANQLLGALVWNGAQRFQLQVHAGFTAWAVRLVELDRLVTEQSWRAGPPLLAQVVHRALDDEAFITQCEELIHGRDGYCLDAHVRVLHQMSLLREGSEARSAAEVAQAAFAFACGLRADQAVIESQGDFSESLEDALLLRQTVRQRLHARLDGPPVSDEPPFFAHFGRAGAAWDTLAERQRRERLADALIDAEVHSGFALSQECLEPAGLVGDLLVKALQRDPGYAALEETLLGEAQARFEIAMDAAELLTDDEPRRQAIIDAAASRAADDAAQLRQALQAHCRALFIPLAARLAPDPQPSAPQPSSSPLSSS